MGENPTNPKQAPETRVRYPGSPVRKEPAMDGGAGIGSYDAGVLSLLANIGSRGYGFGGGYGGGYGGGHGGGVGYGTFAGHSANAVRTEGNGRAIQNNCDQARFLFNCNEHAAIKEAVADCKCKCENGNGELRAEIAALRAEIVASTQAQTIADLERMLAAANGNGGHGRGVAA